MGAKSDVVLFAESHKDDTELLESGKLRFRLTGMEFSATTPHKVLDAYARGRAIKRAKNQEHDYSCYLPHIIGHKFKNPSYFLYCKLTNTTLPKIPDKVQGHVNGKRYRARLAAWQAREERRRERLGGCSDHQTEAPEDSEGSSQKPVANESGNDVLDGISITDDSESDQQSDGASDRSTGAAAPDDSEDEMEVEGATEDLDDDDAADDAPRHRSKKARRTPRKSRASAANGGSPHTPSKKRARSGGNVPKKVAQKRQRFKSRATSGKA